MMLHTWGLGAIAVIAAVRAKHSIALYVFFVTVRHI
jgi:hypothetical protein